MADPVTVEVTPPEIIEVRVLGLETPSDLLPTPSEKAALVGSWGTPSALNPYVTDTDPRWDHITSNGSDHTFIDQDVTSGSSPTFDGINFTGMVLTGMDVPVIGTPTHIELGAIYRRLNSTGEISGGDVTDNGDGTITVTAGTGLIRATNDREARLVSCNWAELADETIPASTTRWVVVEYNGGDVQLALRTSIDWNWQTDWPLAICTEEAGAIHISEIELAIHEFAKIVHDRILAVEPIAYDAATGGLILTESGDASRDVIMSAGALWSLFEREAIGAIDTGVAGTFDSYYFNGSVWVLVADESQWDFTNYNNVASGLVALTTNRYANLWFYIETDGHLVCVYGQAQYTSIAAAESEQPPAALPARLAQHSLLAGRIVFRKSNVPAVSVQSAFIESFILQQSCMVTPHAVNHQPGGSDPSSAGDTWDFDIVQVPGPTDDLVLHLFVPINCTIDSIALWASTQPVTAGAYTLAAAGAGNNLLSAATYDLTGIVADTRTALTLTGTAADLDLSAGDEIEITVDSDNADLSIDSLRGFVHWRAR